MEEKNLQRLFKKAAEIAKSVPEPLQQVAFNRALDALLDEKGASPDSEEGGQTTAKEHKKKRTKKPKAKRTNDDFHPISHLLESMDRTSYTQILGGPRVLERALALLRAAKDDFGIDGLGATAIAKVLTDKFRLRTTRQAVQQALDAAGDKVDRVSPSGSKTYYRIMHPGEVYLDSPQAKTDGKKKSPARKRATKSKMKGKKKAATTRQTVKKEQKRKKSRASKGGRPGPGAMINQLKEEGFFKKHKTITDIIEHCQNKFAYTYKQGEISISLTRALRNQILKREKNDQKQFEYFE